MVARLRFVDHNAVEDVGKNSVDDLVIPSRLSFHLYAIVLGSLGKLDREQCYQSSSTVSY